MSDYKTSKFVSNTKDAKSSSERFRQRLICKIALDPRQLFLFFVEDGLKTTEEKNWPAVITAMVSFWTFWIKMKKHANYTVKKGKRKIITGADVIISLLPLCEKRSAWGGGSNFWLICHLCPGFSAPHNCERLEDPRTKLGLSSLTFFLNSNLLFLCFAIYGRVLGPHLVSQRALNGYRAFSLTWPSICFGKPIWPPWRRVKTLY